jgi:hypothetical protein
MPSGRLPVTTSRKDLAHVAAQALMGRIDATG